ncbi:MAG TPA: iron uptake transporter deferrochelatase/peroxidase subunit [Acidimicrobiia bacterium]
MSRRRLLSGLAVAGAAGAGAAASGRPAFALVRGGRDAAARSSSRTVAFYGTHQAGIATPAQDRLLFGAFDVVDGATRRDVVQLLRDWTGASVRLTQGRELGRNDVAPAPPDDTGEALDLAAANLTITFGFGPSLFVRDGVDRFDIARRRPAPLADLPAFPGDALDPSRSGGDLAVQVCADDPQVAFHALRNLTRRAKGTAGLRWTQQGFGSTASTSSAQRTPRNLMGFKDGTNNLVGDDGEAMDRHVWVGDDDVAWMRNGTYLVARRIRMRIEIWDRTSLREQQDVIGRFKGNGAPLTGRREHDPVDLDVRRAGARVVPMDAHVRLAAPASNDGVRMLRRGYSFTDGVDARTAGLDAGLFFVAYQRDPRRQFVAVQQRLAAHDALNEYIEHTGSALFAVPPGVRRGGWIGETLFGPG